MMRLKCKRITVLRILLLGGTGNQMLKVLLYKNQKERITSTKINRKLLRASIYTFPQVDNHIQIRVPDLVRNRSYYSVTVLRQGLPGVPLDGRQRYRRQKRFHSKT